MAFAHPWALLFLLLSLPVILLYLLKQRRRRVQVSTLLFWDKILRDEQSVTSFTKLRRLLSLALQLLFISLLTLALARPVFSADLLGARRVVVLLDTSASMIAREEDGTRFERAKELAADVIGDMGMGDSAMLVTVNVEPDIVVPFTDSRRALLEALERVEVSHGATRFEGALDLLGHLPSDKRPTYAYAITDGAFAPVKTTLPDNVRLVYLPMGQANENVGITSFQLRALPGSPRDFEILFETSNETKKQQRIPYELRVAENLIDAGEIELAPGTRASRSVKQFSREAGVVELVLDRPDAFALDNRAYALLPRPEPVAVLLVTEGNLFLESALLTDDGIQLNTVLPSEYSPDAVAAAGKAPVVIFDRCSPPSVPSGHAIYIGAWPAGLGATVNGALENPIVTEWNTDHPVNRHLHLTNVAIRKALDVTPEEGFEPLMKSFQHPLVLLRTQDDIHTLLIGFDTTESDLPLRVAFPILVSNAVRYMGGFEGEDSTEPARIGQILTPEDLRAFLPRRLKQADIMHLLSPGDKLPAAPEPQTKGQALEPVLVRKAGVYEAVLSEGERMPLFAVNLNSADESRIAPAPRLPVEGVAPLMDGDRGFRLGFEPWLALVILALILSLGEWFLFHRRWVE